MRLIQGLDVVEERNMLMLLARSELVEVLGPNCVRLSVRKSSLEDL